MPEQADNPLLSQLRDIHTPQEVGLWPPAIGWWILACLLAYGIFKLIRYVRKKHQLNQYRKNALADLKQHFTDWHNADDTAHYLQAVNALLSRVCLHLDDGKSLSSKSGRQWTDALNRYCKVQLDEETVFALTEAAYREQPAVELELVHADVERWIKQHQRSVLAQSSTSKTEEPSHA